MRDIVSRIYPSRIKGHMKQLLRYNGIEYGVDKFMGAITAMSLGIAVIAALFFSDNYGYSFNYIFISTTGLLLLGMYSTIMLTADSRGKFVESILPDVLKLMSSNLKAGLTIDRSLIMAARPEFGHFQDEISRLARKIMSGETFEDSLIDMSMRIKSKNFEVTIDLIVQGIRSGGNLADSLSRIAEVLRDREFVQKEIKSGVQMYVVFIIFAIMFGAPLLFGLSTFLVGVLTGMSENLIGSMGVEGNEMAGVSGPMAMPVSAGSLPISVDFIYNFAIISLVSTSLLGAVVVSLINTGNWKNGIKYMPVFSIVSVGLFALINKILVSSIGSIF